MAARTQFVYCTAAVSKLDLHALVGGFWFCMLCFGLLLAFACVFRIFVFVGFVLLGLRFGLGPRCGVGSKKRVAF